MKLKSARAVGACTLICATGMTLAAATAGASSYGLKTVVVADGCPPTTFAGPAGTVRMGLALDGFGNEYFRTTMTTTTLTPWTRYSTSLIWQDAQRPQTCLTRRIAAPGGAPDGFTTSVLGTASYGSLIDLDTWIGLIPALPEGSEYNVYFAASPWDGWLNTTGSILAGPITCTAVQSPNPEPRDCPGF